MGARVTETTVESAVMDWLRHLGYATLFGPDIAFDGPRPERASYADVVLLMRLQTALARINPAIPPTALRAANARGFSPCRPIAVSPSRFATFARQGSSK